MAMAMNDANGDYSLVLLTIACVTLAMTIVMKPLAKGFFSIIPLLVGLLTGYFLYPGDGHVSPLLCPDKL